MTMGDGLFHAERIFDGMAGALRVAEGRMGLSEFARRLGLIKAGVFGRV